jgi:hypothetical protein
VDGAERGKAGQAGISRGQVAQARGHNVIVHWIANWIVFFIAGAHIDDDNSLPDKVLMKGLFNCVRGRAGSVHSSVRGDTHK